MEGKSMELLKTKCGEENYGKLARLNNPRLEAFIAEYVEICNPDSVFVRTDSAEDIRYIREKAVELKEESRLSIDGHTVHFDGYFDQARDKENTRFLVTGGMNLGSGINSVDREEGLKEIRTLAKNIMEGKELFILFLCLGPVDSDFSIYAVQLTDSSYVAHSEDILYRGAYEVFKKKGAGIDFFKYVHSAGQLENMASKNVDKRRVYIDFTDSIVYTVNTQYAGNTIGLKKLSLRLAIRKANEEKWLAEHMFVMGVEGASGRKTYFTGAFPSFCGKTSTCMVQGESIVGDDIAYLKKRGKEVFAVNVERGIFGIIKNVNSQDDPLIFRALNSPGEIIFSNVLVKDGVPYWQDIEKDVPEAGTNFSGEWFKGKKVDKKGEEIPYAHTNARYTIRLNSLKNCDPALEEPGGVEVKGVIYGGRDSDTWPPVFESFDWAHGVITIAASLESETTAATLGKEGVRKFNPMANLDFLSVTAGKYIQNHLDFIKDLAAPPRIFGVNYFLKDEKGDFLNGMQDKRVWLKWMELRVHGEAEAVRTALGLFPKYGDIKRLFKEVLDKDYTEEDYRGQFTLRVPENIAKIDRILEIYRTKVSDAPPVLFEVLEEQKRRLEEVK